MKKLFRIGYTDNGISFAALMLRLGGGLLMIPYGFNKLTHFSELSQRFTDPFHIGHATTLGLVIFAEFFCAVLVTAGLLTRLAVVPLIIEMGIAFGKLHNWDWQDSGQKACMFLCIYLALLFTGPGKVSLDRLIGK